MKAKGFTFESFEKPSPKRLVLIMILVWLAWVFVNLGANGLFYIAQHGRPELRFPGEVAYFLGVSVVGIIVAGHLARKMGFDLPLWPEKRGPVFWIASTIFFLLAIFLGINAMAEFGVDLSFVRQQDLTWIIAPIFVLAPTMLAYTILWYGFYLNAYRRLLGNSKFGTALAILLTAFTYGMYHIASIDELLTVGAVVDEILITSCIGIAFGIFVVLFRSLLVAFLVNWVLNWFVFTPVDTFHPEPGLWSLGFIVLAVVWVIYRFGWLGKDRLTMPEVQTTGLH